MTIEYSDRYVATGRPYPDPETMCPGPCEGMGVVPIYRPQADQKASLIQGPDEDDPRYIVLWEEAEQKKPCTDGWHFVTCLDCGGTGLRT